MAGTPKITVNVGIDQQAIERVAKSMELRVGSWAQEVSEIIASAPIRPKVPDRGSQLVYGMGRNHGKTEALRRQREASWKRPEDKPAALWAREMVMEQCGLLDVETAQDYETDWDGEPAGLIRLRMTAGMGRGFDRWNIVEQVRVRDVDRSKGKLLDSTWERIARAMIVHWGTAQERARYMGVDWAPPGQESYTIERRYDYASVQVPRHCVAGPRCECPDAVHDREREEARKRRLIRRQLERESRRAAALLREVRGPRRPPTVRDMIALTHRCDCSKATKSPARAWIPVAMRPQLENGIPGAAIWQVNKEIASLWDRRRAEAARKAQTVLAHSWPVCMMHGPLELTWWRAGQWMAKGWWICRGAGR